jgi:hypothetical protein
MIEVRLMGEIRDRVMDRLDEKYQKPTSREIKNMRIAIIGWPGTGKTTLANTLGFPVYGTDSLIKLGWSEASARVSDWFDMPGSWVIEGVAVPRALRKWKARNPGMPPPVDKIIRLTTVYRPLPPGSVVMGRGIDTVMMEIGPWLNQADVLEVR